APPFGPGIGLAGVCVAILASPGGLAPPFGPGIGLAGVCVTILASPSGLAPPVLARLTQLEAKGCDPRQPWRAGATRTRAPDPARSQRLRSSPALAGWRHRHGPAVPVGPDPVAILASPGGLAPPAGDRWWRPDGSWLRSSPA